MSEETPRRHHFLPFASAETLAHALARSVAAALARAVARRGTGLLAVSGGTTPRRFLEALSALPLAWDRIAVTLVDERFVPETSPRSNAALVRDALLDGPAAAARFEPLYRPAASVEEAAAEADKALRALAWPLDAAVLGMGLDGHTASFFPDADGLDGLLSAESDLLVAPVRAASAEEPRLTLPLARILEAPFLALHVEGDDKRKVLNAALKPDTELPVGAVLRQAAEPVRVYWTR